MEKFWGYLLKAVNMNETSYIVMVLSIPFRFLVLLKLLPFGAHLMNVNRGSTFQQEENCCIK